MKQTETIRRLFEKFNGNKDKTIEAYAYMETTGKVRRDSNVNNVPPLKYAELLFYNNFERIG